MLDMDKVQFALGIIVVGAPLLLTCILGFSSLISRRLSEKSTTWLGYITIMSGLLAAIAMLVTMLGMGSRHIAIALGDWVAIAHHYHFSVVFVFDRLSVPFVILSFVLAGTIGAFASQYMHREPGFNRFFVLYAIFLLGMVVTSLAGTIETLFTGWELVGLSSALLVAFYQERSAPPRNGLWVWIVYRVSDAALLLAAVVMHHMRGEGNFEAMMGSGTWPDEHCSLLPSQALVVGLLMLVAAAGKSGLVPFSGWLPRAMEGPTPSSAVFYGALSIHLGAFLLLRFSPLLDISIWLSAAVVVAGLSTAIVAHLAGGVQTDIKSALSFASLVQVGIIVTEIGLGFRYLPLFHILGHACLRTLQFVRAPTLLQDYHTLENAIGDRLPMPRAAQDRPGVAPFRLWLYRWSLERGFLDSFLCEVFVFPFVRVFRWCDRMERRWTEMLSFKVSRKPRHTSAPFGGIEELS